MNDPTVDPALRDLREEIARIDHAIVMLVAARVRAARRAIRLRLAAGEEVTHGTQERAVLDRARLWAEEVAVSPDFIERLMHALVDAGKRWTEPAGEELPPLPERISCRLARATSGPRPSDARSAPGISPLAARQGWGESPMVSR
jgi:chorismate mutase